MLFTAFFAEENTFPADRSVFKILARWRYDWSANALENFKNLRKRVQTLCAALRPFISEMKENFYHILIRIVDVHPYKNILIAYYRVPRKTFKFVPVIPKAHGRANVFAHRRSIKLCNFEKCFGAFYRGWYVVVHTYSNFSLRRQMALVQSIKFQAANFPIFCARIIVIFWTTCIAIGSVFACGSLMGNGKQVLPVLQWLEVVIAFVLVMYLF